MKEFLGFGGYQRPVEGYLSWQHLLFVTSLMTVMVALAVILGRRNRHRDDDTKNKVMIWTALLIDGVELFKIVIMCLRSADPLDWLYNLPLFLCSIQLITIPLAAFARGRIQEAARDFVCIFGILGAVLGTYAAGNNYAAYPVLSLDNVASGITHTLSGFASLYLAITGMAQINKRNLPVTFGILLGFAGAAYIANLCLDANYMFLMQGDGTPYDILYNLVGGSPVLYPLGVLALFFVYIAGFYGTHYLIAAQRAKKCTCTA